jgi:hypothetical protein
MQRSSRAGASAAELGVNIARRGDRRATAELAALEALADVGLAHAE